MPDNLPLASAEGSILYLPEGAVARAEYIHRLATTDAPADDTRILIVDGDVSITTTWGSLKSANAETLDALRHEAEQARDAAVASGAVAISAAGASHEDRLAAAAAAAAAAQSRQTAEAEAQRAVTASQNATSVLALTASYATLGDATAASASLPEGRSVEVTADSVPARNGIYTKRTGVLVQTSQITVAGVANRQLATEKRTASLLDVLPFLVNGRLLQPTEIAYPSGAVTRGTWNDTGEAYPRPNEDVEQQVVALKTTTKTLRDVPPFLVGGRLLQPLEVQAPSGGVQRGYFVDTGEAYPPKASVALLPPVVVEVVSATEIRVHVKGQRPGSSRYICGRARNVPQPERNSDVWRVGPYYESQRYSDGTMALGQQLTDTGENECAIQGMNNANGTGGAWSNLIGGNAHGNEERFFNLFLIDGIPFTPDAARIFEGERFEMIQASRGFQPGATEATTYSPKGANVLDRYCHWDFWSGADGAKLRLTHRIEIKQPLAIFTAYLAMLSIQRWDNGNSAGLVITNAGAREPYWQIEDMSSTAFEEVRTKAAHAKIWGPNGWAAEVRLLGTPRSYPSDAGGTVYDGWQLQNRNFRFKNYIQYNKLYFDFVGGQSYGPTIVHTASAGDIWKMAAEYTFTTRN